MECARGRAWEGAILQRATAVPQEEIVHCCRDFVTTSSCGAALAPIPPFLARQKLTAQHHQPPPLPICTQPNTKP